MTNTFWNIELGQMPATPPAVIGDTVIIPTQDSGINALHTTLRAISIHNGTEQWQQTIEYSLITGLQTYQAAQQPPTAILTSMGSDFLNGEAAVRAINEAGKELWRAEFTGESFSNFALHQEEQLINDYLVCTVDGYALLVIHPQSGKEISNTSFSAPVSLDAPAIHNKVAYLPCREKQLLALGLDGEERWRFKEKGEIWFDQTPVVVGDFVIATSSQGVAAGLDLLTGEKKWEITLGKLGRPLSPAVSDGSLVYLGSRQGVHALDPFNGKTIWTAEFERGVTTKPIIRDGTLAVTFTDHFVRLLDAQNGQVEWEYELKRRIEKAPSWPTHKQILAADRGGQLALIHNELPEPELSQTVAHYATNILQAPVASKQLARQYEKDEQWEKAAQIWYKLDRFNRYAQALEEHARALSEGGQATAEECAAAWKRAAQAYNDEGEKENEVMCLREVARYRELPIVTLDLTYDGLVHNEWSKLDMTIRNEGFGTAYYLTVRSIDDGQFEGQVASTLTFAHLATRRKRTTNLDVRPLQHGRTVPLRLAIQYMDEDKELHDQSQTIYISVARVPEERAGRQMVDDVFGNASGNLLAQTGQLTSDKLGLRTLFLSCQEYLNREDLLNIAFQLGLDEDDLPTRKSTLAREMIRYASRRNLLDEFRSMCKNINPAGEWGE